MNKAREGDLYGIVNVYGKIFEIRYGYYEDYERNSKYNDPVPVYPDLYKSPEYSNEGYPIVTQMQVVCEHYSGNLTEGRCGLCPHFQKGERLFGLCKCSKRQKSSK
ncbi:MAG: hypothetical protein E7581_05440 [Ruminococcaceae bacterium]|nr:hypothetical protein [Oscillospiraceae bacterium]